MQHRPDVLEAVRACAACGAATHTRFCGECGEPVSESPTTTRSVLGQGVAEAVGWERRILPTLRDLLLRPVAVARAHIAGDGRYVPPLRMFFLLGGLYMIALSFAQPYAFTLDALVTHGILGGQELVEVREVIRSSGLSEALVNERFQQRVNTAMPLIVAVAIIPMAWLLGLFGRGRPFHEHVLFMLTFSGTVWLVSFLLLPLARIDVGLHSAALLAVAYVYIGVGFFAMYPGRTRRRTVARFAGFVLADIALSSLINLLLLLGAFRSALHF